MPLTGINEVTSLLAPDAAAQVFLVDEIGKMECSSERFVTAMRALITGETPVVATVGLGGPGFIAEVKGSNRCLLWQVTHANRDQLPSRIAAWLAEEGSSPQPGTA